MINYVKLGSLTSIKTGKLDANAAAEGGEYPFFTCSKEPLCINSFAYDCECVLVAGNGDLNVKYYEGKFEAYQRTYIIESVDKEKLLVKYLYFFLDSYVAVLRKQSIGGVIKYIKLGNLTDAVIPLPDIDKQQKIIDLLEDCEDLITARKQQLLSLDELIKSRFMELFGDLKSNSKGWPIVAFTECAEIDTNMIHDFDGYENYPHIGIDSIEKETGRLSGYRTVAEDGVISGKYLFTEKHIIYSKIRPNLNKVAMPDFVGVCSADAYPILAKDGVCEKVYLAYTMRSKYFLDYILALSSRTNLPKVNKKQVEGFALPLPPIGLQQQFAAFAAQVDKSKLAAQKGLQELEILKKSLMQQYFG